MDCPSKHEEKVVPPSDLVVHNLDQCLVEVVLGDGDAQLVEIENAVNLRDWLEGHAAHPRNVLLEHHQPEVGLFVLESCVLGILQTLLSGFGLDLCIIAKICAQSLKL